VRSGKLTRTGSSVLARAVSQSQYHIRILDSIVSYIALCFYCKSFFLHQIKQQREFLLHSHNLLTITVFLQQKIYKDYSVFTKTSVHYGNTIENRTDDSDGWIKDTKILLFRICLNTAKHRKSPQITPSNTMWHGQRSTVYLCAKFHLDPSNRLATTHQRYTDRHTYTQIDRQTDRTGQDRQTHSGPIILGEPFCSSPKNCYHQSCTF